MYEFNLTFNDIKKYEIGSLFRSENGTVVVRLYGNIEVMDWEDDKDYEEICINSSSYLYKYIGKEDLSKWMYDDSDEENDYYDGINAFDESSE